jgi:hypothetical protein
MEPRAKSMDGLMEGGLSVLMDEGLSLGECPELGAGWCNTPSPTAPSRVTKLRMVKILKFCTFFRGLAY